MSKMPDFFNVGDKPGDSGHESVKTLNVSPKDLHEDPNFFLKYRNCLKFLNHRELGVTAGGQAEKEFCQMKTSHKEKVSSSNLSIPFIYDSCEVRLINGDDKSLFGLWFAKNDRKKNRYILGKIDFDMNNEGFAPPIYRSYENITDICRGPIDVLVAGKFPFPVSPCFVDKLDVVRYIPDNSCPPPWHCCCYLHTTDSAVFGGDNYMVIIKGGRDFDYNIVQLPGKVCTVSHNDDSRIFLYALDTGELGIIDERTDEDIWYSIKISDKAVNDSIFLNDQEVIVTDVEGKLVKVDLRTKKISAEFFGHKHSVIKRPFSVAYDMLCATGIDNVVRIWHISGGHPVHVLNSTSRHEVRGWLNTVGSKIYLNYFESDTRTVFTI